MNRARQAQTITAVVLTALVLFLITRRPRTTAPTEASPVPVAATAPTGPTAQDTVYAMLDAARAGDGAAYLRYFDGELAAGLRQSATEQGAAPFSQYLKESHAPVKGIAVSEVPGAPGAAGETRLRVELVYADRNEAQVMHLAKAGGEWKIIKLETASRVKTLVPYGTPVQ
ncbi:MAG: hypothetical protein FJW31_04215 [Acidobacteria bacterium]|nr:hypothetical protein [Acidobacteriota bacterium]